MLIIFAVTYWASNTFAALAAFIALGGVIAVFYAIKTVTENENAISEAETRLTTYEDWEGAYQHDQHSLMAWFAKHEIDRESGVADVISACWAAFQSKRAVTLSEIHALAARRERTNLGAKLSGLISAMLLIVGIVGTLLSVHPVLSEFNFGVSGQSTEIVSTAESTDKINALMNSLGNAFIPSLFALFGTLIVAAFRFWYMGKLNSYAIKLDHFAIWTVIPRFRPASVSDEFTSLAQAFNGIADGIRIRDKQHEEVLTKIDTLVTKTNTTIAGLEGTVKRINSAADTLASRAASVGDTLVKTLGQPSPLMKVFGEYEKVFERANGHLDKMGSSVDELIKSNQKTASNLAKNAEKFSDKLNLIVETHQRGVDHTQASVIKLHENQVAQQELLKQGLQTLQEHHQSHLEQTQHSLKGITEERKLEADKLEQNLEAIQKHHFEAKAAVKGAVESIDEMVKKLPQEAANSTRDLFLQGLQEVKSEMLKLGRETREDAKSLGSHLKGKLAELQDGLKSTRDANLSSLEAKLKLLPTLIEQSLNKVLHAQDQQYQKEKLERFEVERAQREAQAGMATAPPPVLPVFPPSPFATSSVANTVPAPAALDGGSSTPLPPLPSVIRLEPTSTPIMPPPPPPLKAPKVNLLYPESP